MSLIFWTILTEYHWQLKSYVRRESWQFKLSQQFIAHYSSLLVKGKHSLLYHGPPN